MGIKYAAKDKYVKRKINIKINGVEEEIYVEPWWTLAKVLREELNLTGTKLGCEIGNCGTCTVLIEGKTVKSCLYPVMKAKGKDIITIEGLKGTNGELHPLQESFIEHFAIQCGFCTPGMILSAKALLDENPAPSEAEVRKSLSGNLCRCTGHVKIVEAILAAGQKMRATGRK
jgi:aerobic-type carbon monoxide dehydrogenase small subunit (CoxS/CutS family)